MRGPLITLLTDFGRKDGYVAAMKGVMLQRCSEARFLDISHEVAPQSIAEAAFILDTTFDAFPKETLHVVVIDPGVGSSRAILAVAVAGQQVLAPDNGVLSLLLSRYPRHTIHRVNNEALYAKRVSATFHGRDIFAPVAAYLANGGQLSSVGPPVESFIKLSMLAARVENEYLYGQIIYVDGFGNAVSNIAGSALPDDPFCVEIADVCTVPFCTTYSEMSVGNALALLGSHGRLEIAVNSGNAAAQLGLTLGQLLRIPLSD